MSEQKKIAVNVNVRINVGNYQHIEKTVYAEKTISYNSKEEMVALEDLLFKETAENLVRNMKSLPEILGKKTDAVAKFEDSLVRSIPEWLEKNEIPNLAKDNHNKVTSEQKESEKPKEKQKDNKNEEKSKDDDMKDLFGDL